MGVDATIRPIDERDDIELITEWYESIGRQWLDGYAATPRHRADSRRQLEEWVHSPQAQVLVAERPGERGTAPKLVGFAACGLAEDPNTGHKYGTVHGVYVEPDRRGRRIGRSLKRAADDWCRAAGATGMRSHITADNDAMLALCRALAYKPWMLTLVRRFA
ncbi:MAG: GNAT family N-acetyltransferase [Planctomycetota bacterium]|jgi:GNAT superfamily N-acetyltransferase